MIPLRSVKISGKLGGGQTAYSTLTVTFPWNKKKKTVSCHRFAYMLHSGFFLLWGLSPFDMIVNIVHI
jgi:hypothetical protein